MDAYALAAAMFLGGALLGYSVRAVIFLLRKHSLEQSVNERLIQARSDAQKIIDDATTRATEILEGIRDIEHEKDIARTRIEERIAKRETLLDNRTQELDERSVLIEQKNALLESELKALEQEKEFHTQALVELSGITQAQARAALLEETERQYQEDLNARMYKLETYAQEQLNEKAKNILVQAIQRLATPTTNELTTSTVLIPNEETKGKIIGKEGRNIRSFERAAGVELLVDETPGAIVVSCFDPVRRAIATKALETLIKDGRIQPAKIEEVVEQARLEINDTIKEQGARAVYECGIYSFDPRLVAILGRLHFRTSYGQNVLQHSIEMAHLAEMIASEVGADSYIAKAGALVHDIGKALDHEFEVVHIEIGIKVLQKFNADERIVIAMKSHHDDYPHQSLEAVIVQVADIISSARPGARRDTTEQYLKRINELETLAQRFTGVEKVYALQAGREIRIFVHPESISDLEAKNLARSIALSIETELRYPGQIKVTIIRETRITNYAR